MMAKCPNCGFSVSENDERCPKCGVFLKAPLPPPPPLPSMQQQVPPSSLPAPPLRPNLFESLIEAFLSLFRRNPPVNYPSGVVYEKLEVPHSSVNRYLMVGVVLAFAGFVVVWALSSAAVLQGSGILGVFGVTLAGSIAPSVFVFWMYSNDRFEHEPIALIAYTFGWGAFSTIIALVLNTALQALPSDIIAPLVEEPAKIIGVYWLATRPRLGKEFNNHLDGLIYGVAAGSGFAAVENFLYIARFSPYVGFLTMALVRSVTPIMHAFSTGFVGRWLGLSKVRQGRITWLDLIPGLAVAMLIHGLWNFLPNIISEFGLLLSLPIVFWMYKFAKEGSRDEKLWGYAMGLAPKE